MRAKKRNEHKIYRMLKTEQQRQMVLTSRDHLHQRQTCGDVTKIQVLEHIYTHIEIYFMFII